MHGDICDAALVDALVAEEQPDAIVHFAAESHVDRSILSPEPVIRDQPARHLHAARSGARSTASARFVHVSTDEVYGSLEPPLEADEDYPAAIPAARTRRPRRAPICWRAPTSSPTSCRW